MTTTMTAREGNASIFLVWTTSLWNVSASTPPSRGRVLKPWSRFARMFAIALMPLALRRLKALTLFHDTGSQYVSSVFQAEISFLGIQSSRSFVREPQGNGIAVRFIRTKKENLLWIRRYDTVEELRLVLLEFKDTYNREWIIARHAYKTPAAVRPIQNEAVNVAA